MRFTDQVVIERLEIHFSKDRSGFTGFLVKAEGTEKPNVLSDASLGKYRQYPSAVAFVRAAVRAAELNMAPDKQVLEGAPATSAYSIPNAAWAQDLLNFGGKVAFRGNFLPTRPRKGKTQECAVRLIKPFEVKVWIGSESTQDFKAVGLLLDEWFEACKPTNSFGSISEALPENLSNLPGPRCERFIPRAEVEKRIRDAIHSEKRIVWLYGEDGVGKAEVLRHVLQHDAEVHRYKLSWIDIMAEDGTSANEVASIVATISRQLELPVLMPNEESLDWPKIIKTLSSEKVILVLRHFDRLSRLQQTEVFQCLRLLTAGKGIVVASRPPEENQRALVSDVKISPMSAPERDQFFERRIASDIPGAKPVSAEERNLIFEITGSIPARVAQAVTLLRKGATLKQIREKLIGGLASFEFFSPDCQKVMIALSLCRHGAYLDDLVSITGLPEQQIDACLWPLDGFVEVMRGTSLNDENRWQLADSGTALSIRSHGEKLNVFPSIKEAWYRRYVTLAENVGFCWDDLGRLSQLDLPGRPEMIEHVLATALDEEEFNTAIDIGRDCRYWQYVRGDWMSDSSPIKVWEKAARASGNELELFDALVYQLNIRSKQGQDSAIALIDADKLKEEADQLLARTKPTALAKARYQQAVALWDLAHKRCGDAMERWKTCLKSRLSPHEKSAMRRWLAVCYTQQGLTPLARSQLQAELCEVDGKYERSALMAHLELVKLDLTDGKIADAHDRLGEIEDRITDARDRSFQADYLFLLGRCRLATNGHASEPLLEARDLYERLGKEQRVDTIDKLLKSSVPIS